MKQVKKLLVILPLVALFVLGSLPVLAVEPDYLKDIFNVKLEFAGSTAQSGANTMTYEIEGAKLLALKDYEANGNKATPAFSTVKANLKGLIEDLRERDSYVVDEVTLTTAVLDIVKAIDDTTTSTQYPFDVPTAVKLTKAEEKAPVDDRITVAAYDIFHQEFVPTELRKLKVEEGWKSASIITKTFFELSGLSNNKIYAGFVDLNLEKPIAAVTVSYMNFNVNIDDIKAQLKKADIKADYITLVIPQAVTVKVWHIFPEGTRSKFEEKVAVPFGQWVALKSASQFMNLPEIFKTRIQKVNEEGYTFKELKFFDGRKEIFGLISAYDVFNNIVADNSPEPIHAEVYYDKAVAAAQEVPTEKKVDAATAPQAQIQAQAPVTAANTTTTTAPANTLPVTGASDSIFLFLSSAALMAVGILFFKKH